MGCPSSWGQTLHHLNRQRSPELGPEHCSFLPSPPTRSCFFPSEASCSLPFITLLVLLFFLEYFLTPLLTHLPHEPWKDLILRFPPAPPCPCPGQSPPFLPCTQNLLEAWRLILTCGSTRWDFSLQVEAWRLTWAPEGRSGSSSWGEMEGEDKVRVGSEPSV